MDQNEAKRLAAKAALGYLPEQGGVGLGTGSTARLFIDEVGALVRAGRALVGVPTSAASRQQAAALGVPLADDDGPWDIDVCVDGADEVDERLNLIKGGGGALTREKIVNRASRRNVIIVDSSKLSRRLGERWPVPVEVFRFGHGSTAAALRSFGEPVLRLVDGRPFVTDAGGYIYDLRCGTIDDPAALERELDLIPGVAETGLFVGRATLVIVADKDGLRTLSPVLIREVVLGYDTSFHPVSIELVQERLIPYILGEGAIDDLIARALQVTRTRARAKAWALAAQRLAPAPRRLDAFLHVWGRPFFIVVDDVDSALDVYEQFLWASPEETDALALEQLHALAPGLADATRALLQPAPEPGEQALRDELLWRLHILKDATAAVRQGRQQIEVNGRAHDPRDLLRREVPFAVLSFASALAPGWMSRGATWPSHLVDEVPLPSRPFFSKPEALLGKLPRELPSQGWFLYPTIVENYMVGGLVTPGYVPPLRKFLVEHQGALASTRPAGELADVRRELRKVDEALALAQRKKWAFCEATEIYSGMQGQLN